MTEENYNYRTSQTLLRNQFPGKGKWKIPVLPKFQPKDGDFNDLLLIGFDKTNLEDQNHLDRMVHFFLYDYRFERVWKNPEAMPHEDLDCYKIGGENHTFCDTMDAYMIGKGGGSAYGGKWRPNPNKSQDQRYLGNPGEIKRTIMNNGDVYKTKMGPDGRAEMERHETNHNRGDKHTNPHDHRISWDNPDEHPVPGPPINYPNGAPEFKNFSEVFCMKEIIVPYGSMNFETISEFKRSINWGAEIEFEWNGAVFNIIRYGTDGKITIYAANKPETEKVCETADEALEYMVGDDRLRDIITKVHVVSRSI